MCVVHQTLLRRSKKRDEFYDMAGRLRARKTVLAVLVKKTSKKGDSLKT